MVILGFFSEKKKEYIKKQNEHDFFVNVCVHIGPV